VLSEFLLAEIATTLTRPKLASLVRWPPATVDRFVLELRAACDVVEPAALPLAYPRDPDDIPVLATLLAGQADVLVTGDADLLALSSQFPIETPRQFVRRLW
jgi:putative PIN family toxin of toxin-antitoxin system